jgi:hypothetical protein
VRETSAIVLRKCRCKQEFSYALPAGLSILRRDAGHFGPKEAGKIPPCQAALT